MVKNLIIPWSQAHYFSTQHCQYKKNRLSKKQWIWLTRKKIIFHLTQKRVTITYTETLQHVHKYIISALLSFILFFLIFSKCRQMKKLQGGDKHEYGVLVLWCMLDATDFLMIMATVLRKKWFSPESNKLYTQNCCIREQTIFHSRKSVEYIKKSVIAQHHHHKPFPW